MPFGHGLPHDGRATALDGPSAPTGLMVLGEQILRDVSFPAPFYKHKMTVPWTGHEEADRPLGLQPDLMSWGKNSLVGRHFRQGGPRTSGISSRSPQISSAT